MTIHPSQILFYAGGRSLELFGTPSRRVAPIARRGEDVIETFTRASTGSYIDANGEVKLAEVDALRIDMVDLDGDGVRETPAFLLEDTRKNLIDESEDFSTWTDAGTPGQTASQSSPDGKTGAVLIEDNDGAAVEFIHKTVGFTGDAVKAVSVFVKKAASPAAAGSQIKIRDISASADRLSAILTWSGNTPSLVMDTGSLIESQDLSDDWWRLLFDTTSVTAANTNRMEIVPARTSSETGNLYIFGAQAEDALFPSSYIATAGSTVTRAVETLSFPFHAQPQATTVYMRVIETGMVTGDANARLIQIGTTNGAGDAWLSINTNGTFYVVQHDNGTTLLTKTFVTAPSQGDIYEVVLQLNTDGSVKGIQSIAGGTAEETTASAANTLLAAWSTADLSINSLAAASYGHNQYVDVLIAAGIHSMADCRKATQQ